MRLVLRQGNVARQLARRWGDEAWESLESAVEFPVALGSLALIEPEAPVPFRAVFLLSILDHLDNQRFATHVRAALGAACERARVLGLHTVAAPLLRGGWRASPSSALVAMLAVVDAQPDNPVVLEVHSLLPEHHEFLCALARSLGVRDDNEPR